jgi:hypothetical protein
MAALEANKVVKASYDPCDDSTEDQWAPDDFPPGALRGPFRTPAQRPPTLTERFDTLEAHTRAIARDCAAARHDVLWLTEHWHQAIDRVNEQLGQRARPVLSPVWYWAAGALSGAGVGLLLRAWLG